MFDDDELKPNKQNNNDLNESLDNIISPNDDIKEIKEMTKEIAESFNPESNNEVQDAPKAHFENFTETGMEDSNEESISKSPSEPIIENEFSEDVSVTVQPVKFTSFDEEDNKQGKENKNLNLLMNVNLEMSVELGRTELPFKKVLELTRGSIISLDKLAGEPVELFANGKLVAFGEVVVIEDNFGLRITNIAAPEERLKTVSEEA